MVYPPPVMSVRQAIALRRALLSAGVLAATLVAHGAAAGGLTVVPTAALTWGSMVLVAGLSAAHAPRYAPRGPLAWLGTLVAAQAVLHLVITGAPWAFGVVEHHRTALVSASALTAHAAVAAIWTMVLTTVDGLLARACAAGRRVVRALAARRPTRRPWAMRTPWTAETVRRPGSHPAANGVRGPPVVV